AVRSGWRASDPLFLVRDCPGTTHRLVWRSIGTVVEETDESGLPGGGDPVGEPHERQPEVLDVLDGGQELLEANRLGDVRVCMELVHTQYVGFGGGGREHHHGNHIAIAVRLHPGRDFTYLLIRPVQD